MAKIKITKLNIAGLVALRGKARHIAPVSQPRLRKLPALSTREIITTHQRAAHLPLTKRIVVAEAGAAFKKAITTVEVMGCNVVARNGFVVKVFADGRTKNISKITGTGLNTTLKLD